MEEPMQRTKEQVEEIRAHFEENKVETSDEIDHCQASASQLNEIPTNEIQESSKDQKSSSFSSVTDLLEEEEDELLNKEDAEFKGPFEELSEEVLLAESSDDEPISEQTEVKDEDKSHETPRSATEFVENVDELKNPSLRFIEIGENKKAKELEASLISPDDKADKVIQHRVEDPPADLVREQINRTNNDPIDLGSQPSIIDLCSTVSEPCSQQSDSENELSELSESESKTIEDSKCVFIVSCSVIIFLFTQ